MRNQKNWKLGPGILAVTAWMVCVSFPASAAVIIDDDFNNGEIASGGVNGGFNLVSNNVGGPPIGAEPGHLAVVTNTGNNNNSGLVSVNTFPTAGGFRLIFEVDSLSGDPTANGMFLGLQRDGTTFFRDGGAALPSFGLAFSGVESRTMSENGFALVTNEFGGGGPAANGEILDHGDLELVSLQDGFTAVVEATEAGWAYEISGVNNTDGEATTLANAGPWTDLTDFSFFASEEYLAAYVQGTADFVHSYDRISAEALPEPASLAMVSLGGLLLGRSRRR